jgi:PAS domain S-box-containing protein
VKNYTSSVTGNLHFLSGGGEMGLLIREKDWSESAVGEPANWPQSLRTTLGIIIHSKFPMFLFWGPEHICFYNDAYRPSLGKTGKHPYILGMKGIDAWPEIWDIIKPLMDQVLANGEATWHEDQLIPIYRNGKIEDVYWTFSYSPVYDEAGQRAGVFVTCTETTENVNTFKFLDASNKRYLNDIMQAPVAMCVLRGKNHIVEIANALMLTLWGKTADEVIGKPIFDGLPEVKGQGFEKIIDDVFYTGEEFIANERPVKLPRNNTIETTYINFIYRALKDSEGNNTGIVATAVEVTEQVIARKRIEESEQRVRTLVESAPFPIGVYTGKEMRIELANQAILDVWAKGNDVIGKLYTEILPELQNQEIFEQLDYVFTTGKPFHKRNQRVDIVTNGILEPFYFNYSFTPLFDVVGNVYGVMNTAANVTDLNIAKQDAEESEARFRLLADSMPQFVWAGDADGNLNYFNQSVYNYAGLSKELFEENGWLQIMHPDEKEENIKRWLYSVNTGADFLFEHRFRRYDGEYRWQLSRALPLKDAEGNIQLWIGTSTDIHDIKAQDEQKDYFISMASHELKTPITSIKGYAQILQYKYGNVEDEFLKSSLKTIDKQVAKLTSFIADLLDVSKIKSGNLHFKDELFEINQLVNEVVNEVQHINPGHAISFLHEQQIWVTADRERIGQVVTNFLTNAVKYSPGSFKIDVVIKNTRHGVTVSVQDYGIGINVADQQKIFERFYRVEGKSEKTFPGFGIGLFIAAEIIRRHNGKIGVESKPGNGSLFYFMLPVKK